VDGRCNDGFVARLSASGDKLEWSTYFGGDGSDEEPYAIALDSQSRPVIAGEMGDWGTSDFPQTPGTYGSNAPAWFSQAFAARLAAYGSAIEWAGAFGGEDWDIARSIALDGSDSVYIAGKTESSQFPTTDGALSRLCDGSADEYACTNHPDGFVSKLSADGSQLLASTYLGGAGYDDATGIAIDGAGHPIIAGNASSEYRFPLPDAFQPTADGDFDWCAARADCSDAFLVRLDPALSQIEYGSLYGGKSQDVAAGVALAGGDAWIAGLTHSPDLATTSSAPQPRWAGGNCTFLRDALSFPSCSDVFVARIDSAKPPAPPPPPLPDDGGSGESVGGGSTGGTSGTGGPSGDSQTGTTPQPEGSTLPNTTNPGPDGAALETRTRTVERTLMLVRSARRLRGRLRSSAALCSRRVTVLLERRTGTRWLAVERTRADNTGRFRFRLGADANGRRLRVRAPAVTHQSTGLLTRCAMAVRRVPAVRSS
jgi:hypothetical protein